MAPINLDTKSWFAPASSSSLRTVLQGNCFCLLYWYFPNFLNIDNSREQRFLLAHSSVGLVHTCLFHVLGQSTDAPIIGREEAELERKDQR